MNFSFLGINLPLIEVSAAAARILPAPRENNEFFKRVGNGRIISSATSNSFLLVGGDMGLGGGGALISVKRNVNQAITFVLQTEKKND